VEEGDDFWTWICTEWEEWEEWETENGGLFFSFLFKRAADFAED